jgi:hypothetical protein
LGLYNRLCDFNEMSFMLSYDPYLKRKRTKER